MTATLFTSSRADRAKTHQVESSRPNRHVSEDGAMRDHGGPCGYCGSRSSAKLYSTHAGCGDLYHLNRCRACHAVFLSPRPSDDELARAYDDSYYGNGAEKFDGPVERILDVFRGRRAAKMTRLLQPGARILDIGCGNGKFLDLLGRRGFQAHGVELPGKAAQRASARGLRLTLGPLGQGDYPDDHFDAVTLWHVFEHLTEPLKTMRIVTRILKPGGYLFISMPNIDSWQGRVFRGRWLHLDPPRHLFFFRPDDLARRLEHFSFKLIGHSYLSLEQNPFGMQQSLLNCLQRRRDVLFEALKGNPEVIAKHAGLNVLIQKAFLVATFPLFVCLSMVEAAAGKGGTMELVFRKHSGEG